MAIDTAHSYYIRRARDELMSVSAANAPATAAIHMDLYGRYIRLAAESLPIDTALRIIGFGEARPLATATRMAR